MKNITLLFSTIILIISCNCQKKAIEQNSSSEEIDVQLLPKIVYVANTRGFYQKTTIENNKLYISKNRDEIGNGDLKKLTVEELTQLTALFKTINLEQLSSYKDPTQHRFYDGAPIANLKITVNGKDYQTVDFDHGFPPDEINTFVSKIVDLSKDKE